MLTRLFNTQALHKLINVLEYLRRSMFRAGHAQATRPTAANSAAQPVLHVAPRHRTVMRSVFRVCRTKFHIKRSGSELDGQMAYQDTHYS